MARQEAWHASRSRYLNIFGQRIRVSAPIEVPWLTNRINRVVGTFKSAYQNITFCDTATPIGLVQFADFAPISDAETHRGGWTGSLFDEVANACLSQAALQKRLPGTVNGWDFFLNGKHGDELTIGDTLVRGFQDLNKSPQDLLIALAKGYFEGDMSLVKEVPGFDQLLEFAYTDSVKGPSFLHRLSTVGSYDYRDNTICLFVAPHLLTLLSPQLIEFGIHDMHELISQYGPIVAIIGSSAFEAFFLKNVLHDTTAHEVCHALAYKVEDHGKLVQAGFHKKT